MKVPWFFCIYFYKPKILKDVHMFAVSCFLILKLEDSVTHTIWADIMSVQILNVTN